MLRGARQVGKSYVVEQFGRMYFNSIVTINFELQAELIACFETLQPQIILENLSLVMHQTITPGQTLLFLDEIQDCPNAIRALRYFKEQMPALHVIAAGSLLEFTLNDTDFRMPVGRVQSVYLKPLSFKEFLNAMGYEDLRKYIENIQLKSVISEPVHQTLLKQAKKYMVLGGMPNVLNTYLDSSQHNMQAVKLQQATLLSNYRQDFGKYAKHTQIQSVQKTFEKTPGLIGNHIKYANIDPDSRSLQIKSALQLLEYAGLVYPIYSTSATGIPLITLMNEKKFKLLFLDVGLTAYANRIEMDFVVNDMILMNRSAMAEQWVGQELLAYALCYEEARLYFWCREKSNSQAEVDFIITVGSTIVPVKVKAGATGRLKSLHLFMDERQSKLGVRVSQMSHYFDGRILSIPFYLVSEIERLILESFPNLEK